MNHPATVLKIVGLVSAAALIAGTMLSSCSGGGSSGGTQISSTQKAAASSSAAMGAVQLSSTVGESANMASGSIPAGYAPGKMKVIDTSAIANIDPRLKTVVDKMVSELRKPAVIQAMSNTQSYKAMSAPLYSAGAATATCGISGTYSITYNSVVTGTTTTTTTDTITVTFNNCRNFEDLTYSNLSGSMTGTHVFDTNGYDAADLDVNLTDTVYPSASFTSGTETAVFAMDGIFNAINNNGASGTNSARGSFSWTDKTSNTAMFFSFGGSGTPVTDNWTNTAGVLTHTGNGSFGLAITAPNLQVSLNIGLTNLVHAVQTFTGYQEDSISGRVSINWSPDLSQWGCVNGNYDFTTIVPIRWDGVTCPTQGTLQVNNATIEYGIPLGTKVTVTISDGSGGSISEVFTDCDAMDQGTCG